MTYIMERGKLGQKGYPEVERTVPEVSLYFLTSFLMKTGVQGWKLSQAAQQNKSWLLPLLNHL